MSDPVREKLIKTLDEAHGVELGARRSKAAAKRAIELYDAARPTPLPAPVPPPKTPTPAAWVRRGSIAAVARNFTLSDWLVKPQGFDPAERNAGTDVAAYRYGVQAAGISFFDPNFGVDSTHLHQWFQLAPTSSTMTYAEQMRAGMPNGDGGPINHTIYGTSSVLAKDEAGQWWRLPVVRGVETILYLKQPGPEHPFWREHPELTRSDLPRAIRLLGGIKHYAVEQWPWQHGPAPAQFSVWEGHPGDPTLVPGCVADWRLDKALPFCAPGRYLKLDIGFPSLIGDYIESPDHVSHAAWFQPQGTLQADRRCMIPDVSIHPLFELPPWRVVELAVSSDLDHPELPRGRTAHAYLLEGWDDEVREMIHRRVLDGNLSVSNGIIDAETMLKPHDKARFVDPGLLPYDPVARTVG